MGNRRKKTPTHQKNKENRRATGSSPVLGSPSLDGWAGNWGLKEKATNRMVGNCRFDGVKEKYQKTTPQHRGTRKNKSGLGWFESRPRAAKGQRTTVRAIVIVGNQKTEPNHDPGQPKKRE